MVQVHETLKIRGNETLEVHRVTLADRAGLITLRVSNQEVPSSNLGGGIAVSIAHADGCDAVVPDHLGVRARQTHFLHTRHARFDKVFYTYAKRTQPRGN